MLVFFQPQENSVAAAESKHKAWQKQAKGKKKAGKAKPKKTKQPYQWKKPVQTVGAKTETETTEGVSEFGYERRRLHYSDRKNLNFFQHREMHVDKISYKMNAFGIILR